MCLFFGLLSALFIEQLEIDRKQDEREGEWRRAKGPRPGLEPRAAATRTNPLHMGRLLVTCYCFGVCYRSNYVTFV